MVLAELVVLSFQPICSRYSCCREYIITATNRPDFPCPRDSDDVEGDAGDGPQPPGYPEPQVLWWGGGSGTYTQMHIVHTHIIVIHTTP